MGRGRGGDEGALAGLAGFWESEGALGDPKECAPILNRCAGFLGPAHSPQTAAALARAAGWPALCGADVGAPLPAVAPVPEARILAADAERTFKTAAVRARMVALLTAVADGDYHQGLGYVAAFLALLLPRPAAAAVLARLGRSPQHAAGYWRAKPEAFARDAMVFERLLAERRPAVAAALRKAGVVPEAYAQKWLVGLCVHVLPFRHLAGFVERFLRHGVAFVLRFGLALAEALEGPLLAAGRDAARLLALLRLDVALFPDAGAPDAALALPGQSDDFFAALLAAADAAEGDAAVAPARVEALRVEADAELQEKLAAVRAREARMRAEEEEELSVEASSDAEGDGGGEGEDSVGGATPRAPASLTPPSAGGGWGRAGAGGRRAGGAARRAL